MTSTQIAIDMHIAGQSASVMITCVLPDRRSPQRAHADQSLAARLTGAVISELAAAAR